MMDKRLDSSFWALKIGYGLVPLLAGLDKFSNLLTHWADYLSPLVTRVIPLPPETFMRIVGVIEIIVGLAILTRWTRAGAYVAMVWLLAIAVNLVTTGRYFDIAVRDVLLSVGAFSLACLAGVRRTQREMLTRPDEYTGPMRSTRIA